MISTTLVVLVPVLFVLLLGYFGGRAKAFSTEQVAGINELALDFALPASLFVGVVGISPTELLHDVPFVVAVLVTMLGLYVVALAVGLRVLRLSMSAATLFALGAAFPGTPFFGPAILGGLFGPSSALAIAATAIVGNLLLVAISVVLLEASRRAPENAVPTASALSHSPGGDSRAAGGLARSGLGAVIRSGILHAFKQPYVWAPLLGLVLVIAGIRVPSLLDSMLNLIGQTTSGVSLFVAGLILAGFSFKLNGAVATNVAFKSFLQPGLMLALVGLCGISEPLGREAVIASALPSAVIAPMLAARYGTYQAEAGSTMVLGTLLMVAVLPAIMLLVH